MTIWWKLGLIGGYTLFIFATAWHIHTVFDDAAKLKTATKQAERAAAGESNIIKFNSQIGKADDPQKVGDIKLPASVVGLLK